MTSQNEVVIAMPIYNESEGIVEFLTEIQAAFSSLNLEFVLVNDASTDQTVIKVEEFIKATLTPVKLISNSTNLGHGPSTIRGIDAAIQTGRAIVMTVDGDGQFLGSDMRRLFNLHQESGYSVSEGIRTDRTDPLFRKLTTALTRLLVFCRCHRMPKDANTPLRVYSRVELISIRNVLDADLLTPNLHISALVRDKKFGFKLGKLKVRSLPRRGINSTGTMWQSGKQLLPSKRFLGFAVKSFKQWLFTSRLRGVGESRSALHG